MTIRRPTGPVAALAAAAAAILGLAGCASAEPTAVPMTDVATGDCFDADEAYTTAFVYADCESPHLLEAFWVESMEADGFPGDDAVRAAAAVCDERFTEFVGTAPGAGGDYATMFLGPTAETWELGDRSIVCVVSPLDGQPRSGSAGTPIEA